ncbi:hypothetical protein KO566_03140 [Flavobacteriaceae bacterium XHP0103]|uniref:hypothetical protein n=1 Tax=Marixanthotalea marina TaxID=2844359 RepID=UPI002989A7E1|nr:hypothetical protein [Marixanthotalea marina]MBU3821043.1 hypothetical protein [Marixanthotalea marina]
MKKNITLLFSLLFLGVGLGFSQNEQDITDLSLVDQYVKAKNFDAAYEPFMKIRQRNPKYSRAIFTLGEDILEYKIEKAASDADKKAFVEDQIKLYEERFEHFASETPVGLYQTRSCQLMYENRELLGKTDLELYECFDAVYRADKAGFSNPKSLYTYFSLMVDLYDAGKKPAEELFSKYDDIAEKIAEEVKDNSEKLNVLIEKEEAGTELNRRDGLYKRQHESFLRVFDQVSSSMDSKLGSRANCENLIPLYEKNYEANKTDAVWLQRAVSRLFNKECTEDPLYEKMVKAYDETAPSSDTKYFVGTVLWSNGKENEALDYFTQAFELQTDTYKKGNMAYRIGSILKNKGRYGQARDYFRQSSKLNPSNGNPYLQIASMYASSANSCGDSVFNKQAVYWLAAEEARKAGRVDPTLAGRSKQAVDSYIGRAPSKEDIFNKGNAGETIRIGCWIGASVTVPAIQ